MAKTFADAADVCRYLFDDRNDADDMCLLLEGQHEDDDDNYSTDSSTFGNFWNTEYIVDDNDEQDKAPVPPPTTSPVRKKTRTSYARKPQAESTWSRDYLMPTLRESYIVNPYGRDAKKFRRLFRVTYDLFVTLLVGLCKERWWTDWTPEKVDAAGKLLSSLELKVLGALYVLGTGATQHQVGVQTNLSEEVHRCFFLAWITKMSSIQKEYIFMPTNVEQFERVVGEYSTRGLPGCVGSVDCVHVGWDKCPSMYQHMYTGKEGFPSIAYEVICTARKFIQSVSVGHPGTRNDKHIVRTDNSVMQLLEGNGWLQSKAWKAAGPDGRHVSFSGVAVSDLRRRLSSLAMFDFAGEGRRPWQCSDEVESKGRVRPKKN